MQIGSCEPTVRSRGVSKPGLCEPLVRSYRSNRRNFPAPAASNLTLPPPSPGVTMRLPTTLTALLLCLPPLLGAAEPNAAATPRLLIGASLDRAGASDVYVYDLNGKQERRLTGKPLATCSIVAVSDGGGQVAIETNTWALHVLSPAHDVLYTLQAGRTGAVAFSHDDSAAAYVLPADRLDAEAGPSIRVKPVVAGSPVAATRAAVVAGAADVREVEFSRDGKAVFYTAAADPAGASSVYQLELTSGVSEKLLGAEGHSYWHALAAPDGRLFALRDDPAARRQALVSVDVASREEAVVAEFPAGRTVTAFALAEGGKKIAFVLDGVAGVMDADGTHWAGLSAPLPLEPVPAAAGLRSISDRKVTNAKTPGYPLHAAGRYVSLVLPPEDGVGRVAVYDLRTGTTRIVAIKQGPVYAAFVMD